MNKKLFSLIYFAIFFSQNLEAMKPLQKNHSNCLLIESLSTDPEQLCLFLDTTCETLFLSKKNNESFFLTKRLETCSDFLVQNKQKILENAIQQEKLQLIDNAIMKFIESFEKSNQILRPKRENFISSIIDMENEKHKNEQPFCIKVKNKKTKTLFKIKEYVATSLWITAILPLLNSQGVSQKSWKHIFVSGCDYCLQSLKKEILSSRKRAKQTILRHSCYQVLFHHYKKEKKRLWLIGNGLQSDYSKTKKSFQEK